MAAFKISDKMRAWWRAALVRAIKTAAQAAVGVIGAGAIGVVDVNWLGVLSTAALAAIVSLLTSVQGLPEVEEGASVAAMAGKDGE